ncbi:MAG: LytTR family DNA-binding domain-containing protein [Gemmatimonadaceae bacterium]
MIIRLRVVVADDEAIARDGLCAMLAADEGIEVVAACADGSQAVKAIRELQPDIVFLDVQMPGLDGFAVVREIESERVPVIVFVTAYDQYALKAFDVHAVDYLLKPFDDQRFQLALSRAKTQARATAEVAPELASDLSLLSERLARFLDSAEQPPHRGAATYPSRIVLRTEGNIRFVRTKDLVWIEAADYYVKLHVGGKVHMLRESMTSLENRLDPAVFFRTSRSGLVNLDHVREIQPYAQGDYIVLLDDGAKTRLTQTRRDKLAFRLEERS